MGSGYVGRGIGQDLGRCGGADSEHGAGTGAAAFLVEKGVGVVIAAEVGPKAAEALKAAGLRIESSNAGAALGDAMADIISLAGK